MAKIAILGFGTVGSGVYEVLCRNAASVSRRAGEPVEVKYILDPKDFSGHPAANLFVKNFDVILEDPEIRVVVETIGGVGFQACTYVTSEKRDAFLPLEDPEGARILAQDGQPPRRWLARMFANRFNFDSDKIVLEYREPLPEDITSITALPLGRADYIAAFEQRAREAFMVETAAVPAAGIMPQRNIGALQWRYMDETFWGTVSPYDRMDWR